MKRKYQKGYLCGTDLQDIALGATDVVIYPTMTALKKNRLCWRECGIVELELKPKTKVKPNFKYGK